MEFKEFNEYPNPEESDYDIKSSLQTERLSSINANNPRNIYKQVFTRLYVELGCPEYEELEEFGITLQEINKPAKETFQKLKRYAQKYQLQISKEAAEEIREYYQTNNNKHNR